MKIEEAIEKIKHLLHLHACEQEGLASGQPTAQEWLKAVDEANEAVTELEGQISDTKGLPEIKELFKSWKGNGGEDTGYNYQELISFGLRCANKVMRTWEKDAIRNAPPPSEETK